MQSLVFAADPGAHCPMFVATHTGVPLRNDQTQGHCQPSAVGVVTLHSCHQLLDLGLSCIDWFVVLQCGSYTDVMA